MVPNSLKTSRKPLDDTRRNAVRLSVGPAARSWTVHQVQHEDAASENVAAFAAEALRTPPRCARIRATADTEYDRKIG
jgi:hypothetical protein